MAPLDNRRFQYLGLVNCPHLPYMHKYIPAAKVQCKCFCFRRTKNRKFESLTSTLIFKVKILLLNRDFVTPISENFTFK